jgi:hypothetical protein
VRARGAHTSGGSVAAFRGIEHLRRASEILCETPRATGDRLAEALHAFWTASLDYDLWPAAIQKQADEVRRLIFSAGTIRETVAAMDAGMFSALKEKICALAAEAERIDAERLGGGPHLYQPRGERDAASERLGEAGEA